MNGEPVTSPDLHALRRLLDEAKLDTYTHGPPHVRCNCSECRAWYAADIRHDAVRELCAAVPHLVADNERLRRALQLAARWLGSGNATETFDDIAEWFYHETGMMRPGKSVPLEMGNTHTDEERADAFHRWTVSKGQAVRAFVREALGPENGDSAGKGST